MITTGQKSNVLVIETETQVFLQGTLSSCKSKVYRRESSIKDQMEPSDPEMRSLI